MLRALSHAAQLRDPGRLKAWLCRILANCLRDHFRRTREFDDIEQLDEAVLSHHETPERMSAQSELAARVHAAIASLPLGQRQVVTLVDLEDCSYAEVAEALSVPVGTVMSRLSRARHALKVSLLDDSSGTGAGAERIRLVR